MKGSRANRTMERGIRRNERCENMCSKQSRGESRRLSVFKCLFAGNKKKITACNVLDSWRSIRYG